MTDKRFEELLFGAEELAKVLLRKERNSLQQQNAELAALVETRHAALEKVDHTLFIHGHIDSGTDLHQLVREALDLTRSDALNQHDAAKDAEIARLEEELAEAWNAIRRAIDRYQETIINAKSPQNFEADGTRSTLPQMLVHLLERDATEIARLNKDVRKFMDVANSNATERNTAWDAARKLEQQLAEARKDTARLEDQAAALRDVLTEIKLTLQHRMETSVIHVSTQESYGGHVHPNGYAAVLLPDWRCKQLISAIEAGTVDVIDAAQQEDSNG